MISRIKSLIKVFVLLFFSAALFLSVIFIVLICPRRPMATVLLYHGISANAQSSSDTPVLPKAIFEKQLKYLNQHHYKTVFFSEVIDRRKNGLEIPRNWVVLTFDSSEKNFYTQVYPLLKKYQCKAVIFIVVGFIDTDSDNLTSEELSLMQKDGWLEIGSHSLYHLPLTCLDPLEAEKRLALSKKILEDKLGIRIQAFAYPYGQLNNDVKNMVKKAGYDGAVGIVYKRNKFPLGDIYNVRRVYVSEISKYPFVFGFMLSGYYVPTRGLLLKILNIDAPRDGRVCND